MEYMQPEAEETEMFEDEQDAVSEKSCTEYSFASDDSEYSRQISLKRRCASLCQGDEEPPCISQGSGQEKRRKIDDPDEIPEPSTSQMERYSEVCKKIASEKNFEKN